MATYTPPRTPGSISPGGRPSSPGGTHPTGPPLGDPPPRGAARPPYPRAPRTPVAPGSVDPRRATRPGPKDPRTRPFSAPRHTRPFTGPGTGPVAEPTARPARPTARPAARPAFGRTRPRHPRAPFILLLVGLLGGALVSLLVISTTLAEGSYRITSLQQQNANLAKQEQLLAQQVAQDSSPTQIAQEAEQFGMRPNPNLQFINLKTRKVVSGHPSRADSQISVPGYTP
jgi:hypothetical protein